MTRRTGRKTGKQYSSIHAKRTNHNACKQFNELTDGMKKQIAKAQRQSIVLF